MKKRLKILVLILAYFVLCAKSCDDDSSQGLHDQLDIENAKDSIRLEFEVDVLSEQSLYAAEISAIQKLKDLSDYIKIFADVSMGPVFREKAGEMIGEMFVSEDCSLSFGPVKKNNIQSVTLGEFMEKGFGDDIFQTEVSFDSIRVQEHLQKSDESTYSGKLAAFQTTIVHPPIDSFISTIIPVTIDFISSKQVKIIGQDTLRVWEVSLGDMDF